MDMENALNIAKDVLGIARQKTEEIIYIEKLRAMIASQKFKRDKDYKELGKLYYTNLTEGVTAEEKALLLIKAIDEKTLKINRYYELIKLYKNKDTTTDKVSIDTILKK